MRARIYTYTYIIVYDIPLGFMGLQALGAPEGVAECGNVGPPGSGMWNFGPPGSRMWNVPDPTGALTVPLSGAPEGVAEH